MSAIGGGGNYISDSQIMVWLANQQDRVYGDLRDSMDLAETRASFSDALNDIKAHLDEANRSKDFGKVDGELQAFIDKYGSDPNFAETCDSVREVADKIHVDYENAKNYDVDHAKYQKDLTAYLEAQAKDAGRMMMGLPRLAGDLEEPQPPAAVVKSYKPEDVDTWKQLIDDKLDTSGKNDQLTMIHIQELKATLDQGAQLGSSFISSGDKTSSAIINNIA
jgi:hypothetical protein